jgi:hypothetical protein
MRGTWQELLHHTIILPRAQQFGTIQQWRTERNEQQLEAWNSAFGPASLYEAWAQLPLMQGLYKSNRTVLRRVLDGRSSWHVVEIGGGNGALWQHFFSTQEQGTFTLIDPQPEVHAAVAARLPENITFHSIVAPVEQASIPEADALICSLTLHHIAGLDRAQRRSFGFTGDGKQEVLQRFVQALADRQGVGILNEADCYNEIDLPSRDPVLIEHFLDVYVRRAAMAVATALETEVDEGLRNRWEVILQHWCLDQIEHALVARAERDVYELDVVHWLTLLKQAGAQLQNHQYTDEWYLFQQYIFYSDKVLAPLLKRYP